ncbi:hypothetical protein PSTEL_08005 [Paenibacillus stellifer]|jgi:Predicted nuclease of the RecB family|uniref:Uncharacterized protein n=1 Tax=Paenibacillus stellifer TaxID=169760 RepID=A0A089LQ97_9BACL|nr:hypothetical protein [Paenibacillus stellifer]AIQ63052.1 hypothetical protein PSTEL_08005 [Paenibacillus stellifer]
MYAIKDRKAVKIDAITFSEIGWQESDIEEILRNSIDMICDEEESMLIVGRQVKNEMLGRSDLTAVDSNGNIVLIEIKRDRKDIENRKEAFEFQAIRYAASYATIDSIEDLVTRVYGPYIDKYKTEFELGELTPYELGIRKLNGFLRENGAEAAFNHRQRIILVASEFDEQTLSAVAWLNKNNVDMCCFKLTPFKIGNEVVLYSEKLLPLTEYDDYYVNLLDKASPIIKGGNKRAITRRSLPKIDSMLEWGIIKPGDLIVAKDRQEEGVLLKNGHIEVNGRELSLQLWLKEIFGWSSVQTYNFAIHKESGKTLSQLREEYLSKIASETTDDN